MGNVWEDGGICTSLEFKSLNNCGVCFCVPRSHVCKGEEGRRDPRLETAPLVPPGPPLTPCKVSWAALVAGRRKQSSQYPNSTPDARTPFFLSVWIRNMAKLWTGELGWAPGGGEGEREPRSAPCPPPGRWGRGEATARSKTHKPGSSLPSW